MRNLKLVDGVIALHSVAALILEETDDVQLAEEIRSCADRLHLLSIQDDKANEVAKSLIKQAQDE